MEAPELRRIHICSDEKVNRVGLAKRIVDKSRQGHRMTFREVDFAEIEYTEKRGRMNDLVNKLSKSRLGMSYRRIEDIIDAKIATSGSFLQNTGSSSASAILL